jgi:hypothetical protein
MASKPLSTDGDHSLSGRLRWLGLLPLIFFLARLSEVWGSESLADLLWMCNIANLALALGLFAAQPAVIRSAVIWLGLGLPMWIWYLIQAGRLVPASFLTHIGALAIGLVTLASVRINRRAWLYAFVWFLLMQQLCRWITPDELNVNMSQGLRLGDITTGWERIVSAYWQFWLISTPLTALCLWIANCVLWRLFPLRAAGFKTLSVKETAIDFKKMN